MADFSWIRLDVDLLDSRKVKSLRRMDFGDAAVITWIFLLTTAGKCNDGGRIFIDEDVPYDVCDIAGELGYDPQITGEHIAQMVRLRMIDIDEDGYIHICGWEDHQSADRLAELKEMHRERQRRYLDKKKNDVTNDVTHDVTMTDDMTSCDALDKDKDKEKDRDKEKEKEKEDITKAPAKPAPVRHRYGKYENVLLSDEELEKVKNEFPGDWQDRIEKMSEYMASNGKSYKNYLAAIRNWKRMEDERGYSGKSAAGNQGKTGTDEGRVFGILI